MTHDLNEMRRSLLSLHHWRSRLLLWLGAASVGVVAVAFAKLADVAQDALQRLIGYWPWWPWLAAPIGFGVIAWLTRRFFPGAEGSGIPQTIFALQPHAGLIGESLLRIRVVVGRVFLAGAGLFCGGSIGREGPTVHVGAALIHAMSRWMPHGRIDAQRRTLVLAGGAAGVAAAFNTPLAGIVFAIEELSRSFEERASGTTLTAVILAGVIAIALVGNYSYFGSPVVTKDADTLSWMTLVLAIACGLAGGMFSRVTIACVNNLPLKLQSLRSNRPVLFALGCGLCIAGIGSLCHGMTFGTGYREAQSILEGQAHLSGYYAPGRALATLISYLSGIPAGLLAPSLSVGAGFGQWIADLTGQVSAVPFAILGMCGYLTGVTQAPLTSFVIVMEMTGQHAMVLPLMVTAAIATAISRLLSPPLYQTLAARYAR